MYNSLHKPLHLRMRKKWFITRYRSKFCYLLLCYKQHWRPDSLQSIVCQYHEHRGWGSLEVNLLSSLCCTSCFDYNSNITAMDKTYFLAKHADEVLLDSRKLIGDNDLFRLMQGKWFYLIPSKKWTSFCWKKYRRKQWNIKISILENWWDKNNSFD